MVATAAGDVSLRTDAKRRWGAGRILNLRVAAVSLATITGALTVDAMLEPVTPFDTPVLENMQRVSLPLMEPVLHAVDMLTSSNGAIAAWLLTLVIAIAVRHWLAALAIMVLPVGGLINNFVGEVMVGRTRPADADGDFLRTLNDIQAASFPSGHVMGAVMLYGLLFFLATRMSNRPLALGLQTFSAFVLATVGFGRIWFGAHWPTDVLAAYTLGGLILIGIIAVYQRLEIAVGDLPFIHAAEVEHDEAQPHAHALTSTVFFNGGTVSKVYAPGFLPRAIYWLAYQAEFPYIRNRRALEAARERRNLAGKLTEFWYGSSRVAEVTAIERVGDQYAVVSEFVDGHAPSNKKEAKAYLTDLRGKFEAAGLPTWQIDPRQPRAVDNILETADGSYHIVDLESGLVSPLASLKTWWRAIRRGMVPIYDDVYFDVTRAYVAEHEAAMRAQMGDAWLADLQARIDAAETATAEWHASEPRIWSKLLSGLWTGFGIRTWRSRATAKLSGGQQKATDWLTGSVATWESEGRLSAAEAADLKTQIESPTIQAILPHLGAHLAITVVLRFPFGSIARMAWTGYGLGAATVKLLARRIDRKAWKQAWEMHHPLVFALSAIPGFGAFAYLAAKPVRSNRLLVRLSIDAVMQKLPKRAYERTGLRRLVARPAGAAPTITTTTTTKTRREQMLPALEEALTTPSSLASLFDPNNGFNPAYCLEPARIAPHRHPHDVAA
jgi:undecaprenyl-diphosphatase